MNIKYIFVVLGEPYSTFSEIIGKYFKKKKTYKKKIILVGNISLLKKQLSKLKIIFPINKIENYKKAKKNIVNIIDVKFKHDHTFSNISSRSNNYIEESFKITLGIIKKIKNKAVLINGPISKKSFLNKKYLGITEYLSKKTKSKNEVMLIYNESFSVTPLTTHIPLKYVNKNITQNKIKENVLRINEFYNKKLKKKIKLAILGLNPHCETIDKFSEEEKIIKPSIRYLKSKGINIDGPYSADTFFFEKNIRKYDVVIGMYHDQVLTAIKMLFKFDAINITLGLPFIRISPDHGPNSIMIGKNRSDPSSFIYSMRFIEKYIK